MYREQNNQSTQVTQSFLRGIKWFGMMKILGQIVSWASTLVVARLLSPNDYGIVGMATIYLGMLQVVSDFGIGTVVVARSDISREVIPDLNSLSVIFGVSGAALGIITAPIVSSFYNNPSLPPVLAAMSLTFLIASFRSIPWASLQRDLRFKRLAIYDGLQAIVVALLSVMLAYLGFRYWTLVIANIVSTLISTIIVLILHPVPFVLPRWDRLAQVLRFSGNVVVQRLAWYGYSNADAVVAGRMLGTDAMGSYSMAYQLARTPSERVASLLFQLTPATLGALREDREAMRRFIVRMSEMLMLVITPMCFGLLAIAPVFVPLVLGPQWVEIVLPLQILSIYASFAVLLVVPNQVLLVIGMEVFGTYYTLSQLAIMPVAFVIGSKWGITGIAIAWLVCYPFLATILLRRVFKELKVKIREFFQTAILPSLAANLVMVIAVYAIRNAMALTEPGVTSLVISVSTGIATYLGYLYLFHRQQLSNTLEMVKRLRRT